MQWKKEVSGNSGKDLHAATHQIEVFRLNWQQNECHHDIEKRSNIFSKFLF